MYLQIRVGKYLLSERTRVCHCGIRNGTLCNKILAIKLLDLDIKAFYDESYRIINDDDLKDIL
jgi:hypothetical protein